MRDTYTSRETQGKLESDQRKELSSRAASEISSSARQNNAYHESNAAYMDDQKQQQKTIIRQQDESLNKMSNSLDRLQTMANEIDTELEAQNVIINDIDNKVDEVQGKMNQAIKGVETLLKTKDRCQLCTIAVLVIIFLIGAESR